MNTFTEELSRAFRETARIELLAVADAMQADLDRIDPTDPVGEALQHHLDRIDARLRELAEPKPAPKAKARRSRTRI